MKTTQAISTTAQRILSGKYPPVCGGSEVGDGAPAGVATVNGDPVTAEELADIRNARNWKARQHETDDRLKSTEADLRHREEVLREQERTLAAERTSLVESRVAPAAAPAEPTPLPNPMDDPEGYAKARDDRERVLLDRLDKLENSQTQLSGQLDEFGRSVDGKINGSAEYNRVVGHNDDILDRYARTHDLAGADLDTVRSHLQAFRVPGQGYGEYVDMPDGRRVWEYTDKALDAADWAGRRSSHEQRLADEHYARGQKDVAAVANNSSPLEFGSNGVPAKDAPIAELASYYYSLAEQSPAATRFMDSLPLDAVKGVLSHGAESAASVAGEAQSADPLGSQAGGQVY